MVSHVKLSERVQQYLSTVCKDAKIEYIFVVVGSLFYDAEARLFSANKEFTEID